MKPNKHTNKIREVNIPRQSKHRSTACLLFVGMVLFLSTERPLLSKEHKQMGERVGDTLDLSERNYFGMFDRIDDYKYAVAVEEENEMVRFEITRQMVEDTIVRVTLKTFSYIIACIDQFEDIEGRIPRGVPTEFFKIISPRSFSMPRAVEFRTADGVIVGHPLLISDSGIVCWTKGTQFSHHEISRSARFVYFDEIVSFSNSDDMISGSITSLLYTAGTLAMSAHNQQKSNLPTAWTLMDYSTLIGTFSIGVLSDILRAHEYRASYGPMKSLIEHRLQTFFENEPPLELFTFLKQVYAKPRTLRRIDRGLQEIKQEDLLSFSVSFSSPLLSFSRIPFEMNSKTETITSKSRIGLYPGSSRTADVELLYHLSPRWAFGISYRALDVKCGYSELQWRDSGGDRIETEVYSDEIVVSMARPAVSAQYTVVQVHNDYKRVWQIESAVSVGSVVVLGFEPTFQIKTVPFVQKFSVENILPLNLTCRIGLKLFLSPDIAVSANALYQTIATPTIHATSVVLPNAELSGRQGFSLSGSYPSFYVGMSWER